jgi:hypothetical protein
MRHSDEVFARNAGTTPCALRDEDAHVRLARVEALGSAYDHLLRRVLEFLAENKNFERNGDVRLQGRRHKDVFEIANYDPLTLRSRAPHHRNPGRAL